ncbi:MAG: CehA/McbA family metallohydrolase [Anaerolineales bacterium]
MSEPPVTNAFDAPGQWYRASLHTHTTESDGAWSPQAVLDWHRAHGYQVVALTDHDRITEAPPQPSVVEPVLVPLPGVEISLGRSRQGSPIHLVAVGLNAPLADRPQSASETLDWVWENGAFGYLAHPYWSGLSNEELAVLGSIRALEIFNTSANWENRKGEACAYWDDLLGRRQPAWGLATDDSHWRDPDHGGGWVMVKAKQLTAAAVVYALRRGLFFSTNHPTIESIRWEGTRLWIRSSPVDSIYWIGAGRLGWSRHTPAGSQLSEAEFHVKGNPAWIRIEVCDDKGRRAWSNPIYASE